MGVFVEYIEVANKIKTETEIVTLLVEHYVGKKKFCCSAAFIVFGLKVSRHEFVDAAVARLYKLCLNS